MEFDPRTVSIPELRNRVLAAENQRRQERAAENAADTAMHRQFDEFMRTHPDFQPTQSNLKNLVANLVFDSGADPKDVFEGRAKSEHWSGAHALASYERVYESAPAPTPETMPLQDLRAQVVGESAPAPEYSAPLSQLREQVMQMQQNEPAPSPQQTQDADLRTMPLGQLRELAIGSSQQ